MHACVRIYLELQLYVFQTAWSLCGGMQNSKHEQLQDDWLKLQCFAGWLAGSGPSLYVNSLLYPWVQYNRSLHSHYFKLRPEPANQLQSKRKNAKSTNF